MICAAARRSGSLPCLLLGNITALAAVGLFNMYMLHTTKYRVVMPHESTAIAERPRLPEVFHEHNNELEMEHRITHDRLRRSVRVLCLVLTQPENHEKKAIHVKRTWGQRCNKLLFMSTERNDTLPSVALDVPEGRNYLWSKTRAAFKYAYNNSINEYDWFFKADDDTYVIVENLRYMLSAYDTDKDAIYFGCKFKKHVKKGYMSGGAGYVLSRKSLKMFVEKALSNSSLCPLHDTWTEDIQMGKCLYNVGVMAGDSRDSHGRGRLFPMQPETHLTPGTIGKKHWYWNYTYYPIPNSAECCSDLAVSFHYVDPNKMYELEYYIYHLHPYGIQYKDPFPSPLPPDKQSIPQRMWENKSSAEKATNLYEKS